MSVALRITDSDIDAVEKILLPGGETFDVDRRAVIKCLETKDVLACPGSGKTTALLAKLLIIAPQLPLPGNQGVCVLTHTNVAIDEIKNKMDRFSDRLFSYPNHFGTIQSFVDRYLCIPEYVRLFGKRGVKINTDIYDDYVERVYLKLSFGARKWLEKKDEYMQFLKSIRFRPEDFVLTVGLDGNELMNDHTGPAYQGLRKFKTDLLKMGALSYEDAYSLAFQYLSLYPQLRNLFSKRFPIVLIDEMQDTDSYQIKLLEKVFDPQGVVIQRIGDVNQSIYERPGKDVFWNVQHQYLQIKDSKRFSHSIAKTIRTIAVLPQEMEGNSKINEISPIIILFNDANIQRVISRFADLILSNGLQSEGRKLFKAIGWVGKKREDRHTIPDYWPKYKVELHTRKENFSNLWNYLVPQDKMTVATEGVNVYRKSILRAFIKVLSLLSIGRPNNMPFTESTLPRHIQNIDPYFLEVLNENLTKWCLQTHAGNDIHSAVNDYIRNSLCPFFGVTDLNQVETFLTDRATETHMETHFSESNTYIHHSGFKIDISTIHGVKGETHTATLYLETFYYDYDVLRIIEYMKGKHPEPKGIRLLQNLRMAYVGMSRPTHLLCVSLHRQHIDGHEKDLEAAGWKLDYELA